jgi:hypothetical protein
VPNRDAHFDFLDARSVASKCSVEDSRPYLATVEAVDARRVIHRCRQVAAGDEDAARLSGCPGRIHPGRSSPTRWRRPDEIRGGTMRV